MRRVLITGCSGSIGKVLAQKLLGQNATVYGLFRKAPSTGYPANIYCLNGDVSQYNLGLVDKDMRFDAVYHCAGSINLGEKADTLLLETNVHGTKNAVAYCEKYAIRHLYYVSTAYAGMGHNFYESSKEFAEKLVLSSTIPNVTIFKPSIVLSPSDGHFSRFIETLIMVHRRAELVRRKIEGTLRLPVIEPVFRIKGNPDGHLNLVTVEDVVEAMAEIQDEGIYWLINPQPPTLCELGEIVGKTIMVNLKFEQDFKAMPLELAFDRLARPFIPYLQGESLAVPSTEISENRISQDFVENYIKNLIYKSD